jgi:hypothetical protein
MTGLFVCFVALGMGAAGLLFSVIVWSVWIIGHWIIKWRGNNGKKNNLYGR